MSENLLPKNLDEAIEILMVFYKLQKDDSLAGLSEDDFNARLHMSGGMFIRNSWYLWWYPNHGFDAWPVEKPALVEWFNNIDIYHADDMSGIINTSLYRHATGIDRDLEGQIERYKKHWRKYGFADGIYKQNRK